jgi:hypothetical protein
MAENEGVTSVSVSEVSQRKTWEEPRIEDALIETLTGKVASPSEFEGISGGS